MGQLIDWALKQVDGIPAVPFPFIAALLILFALVFPTVRRAWRSDPHGGAKEATPIIQMNAGGVYTILVNLEIQLANMQREMGQLSGQLGEMHDHIVLIDRLLRRRQSRGGQRKKPDSPDD